MKKIKNILEAGALALLFTAFRLLPLDLASYLGGWMARAIGPFLSAHKTASANIDMVYPNLSANDKRRILTRMWDNLGRVAGELPHLPGEKLVGRIHLTGAEHFPAAGQQVLFFSGHFGNWELLSATAFQHHVPVTLIYREANNPHVDAMIANIRATQASGMFPKGFRGAVKMARAIKGGHSIAMLIDQKMNDGIPVPFFGRDAMTAPAIAELSLRYGMPIIPARVVRTKGCHFEATIFPPRADGQDVRSIMTQINAMLETWIREHPEQWFWVHRRWPKT